MLREGMWGSDLPLIEPRHVAVYHFQFVWFLKLGCEILRYGDFQDIIHIWGWVHNNFLKDKFQQVVHVVCTKHFLISFYFQITLKQCCSLSVVTLWFYI